MNVSEVTIVSMVSGKINVELCFLRTDRLFWINVVYTFLQNIICLLERIKFWGLFLKVSFKRKFEQKIYSFLKIYFSY